MNVLVIVAHPDDEVMGMGGTIKKLSKSGHDIKILFLSTGILARRPFSNDSSNKTITTKFLNDMEEEDRLRMCGVLQMIADLAQELNDD